MILQLEQIKQFILDPSNGKSIDIARSQHRTLNMHINGVDVKVEKIDGYENETQKKLRDKLTRSNKALYQRLLQPVNKIFSSKGGSRYFDMSDTFKDDFTKAKYKGYSIKEWIKHYVNKLFVDPNGLFFIEVDQNGKSYPTYKSINDIHDYFFDGLTCEYVIFLPTIQEDGSKIYRVVDSEKDISIRRVGEEFTVVHNEIYPNTLGYVPAILVSNEKDDVYNVMTSPVWNTIETAEEYLQNNSTKSVYKYAHLFPIFWRYVQDCPTCKGTGQIKGEDCQSCKGTGVRLSKDVADIMNLRLPESGEIPIAPNVAGYIQPDIETLVAIRDEVKELVKEMEYTLWGSNTKEDSSNDTATAAFINVQPVYDKLNQYSDWCEYVDKFITDTIGKLSYGNSFNGSSISYGRIYIFETPDQIMQKYIAEKSGGVPKLILDYRITQFYQSQFQSDSVVMLANIKLIKVMPFVHSTDEEIKALDLPEIERYKKYYSDDWKNTLDADEILKMNEEQLDNSLTEFAQKKLELKPIIEPILN